MCSFSISKLTDHHDAHNLSREGNANYAMTSQSKATLMLLFITACWGLTFILIKNTVQSITPFTFVALRFLLAALILGLVFKYGFRIEMINRMLAVHVDGSLARNVREVVAENSSKAANHMCETDA